MRRPRPAISPRISSMNPARPDSCSLFPAGWAFVASFWIGSIGLGPGLVFGAGWLSVFQLRLVRFGLLVLGDIQALLFLVLGDLKALLLLGNLGDRTRLGSSA